MKGVFDLHYPMRACKVHQKLSMKQTIVLAAKLSHLEKENQKLVEELDKERVMIRTLNSEFGNMKTELEHEVC